MMWRKSSDGSELSISFELVYRLEVFHSVCHRFFIALFPVLLLLVLSTFFYGLVPKRKIVLKQQDAARNVIVADVV